MYAKARVRMRVGGMQLTNEWEAQSVSCSSPDW